MNKEEKIDTVTSMEINELHNFTSDIFNDHAVNLVDIPGQGFYKLKILALLPSAKVIILFLDASDK